MRQSDCRATGRSYQSQLSCSIYKVETCSRSTLFFFFNDTATTEIYTLSLHDALPISRNGWAGRSSDWCIPRICRSRSSCSGDRKSTRLNSSHLVISYAVFCLKKKKNRGLDESNLLERAVICRRTSGEVSKEQTELRAG